MSPVCRPLPGEGTAWDQGPMHALNPVRCPALSPAASARPDPVHESSASHPVGRKIRLEPGGDTAPPVTSDGHTASGNAKGSLLDVVA